jgi:chromosome segregation ATPase
LKEQDVTVSRLRAERKEAVEAGEVLRRQLNERNESANKQVTALQAQLTDIRHQLQMKTRQWEGAEDKREQAERRLAALDAKVIN